MIRACIFLWLLLLDRAAGDRPFSTLPAFTSVIAVKLTHATLQASKRAPERDATEPAHYDGYC